MSSDRPAGQGNGNFDLAQIGSKIAVSAPESPKARIVSMDYQKYSGLSQSLFEESNEARFLLDADMQNVLEANAAGQRLSGFSLKDLISLPVTGLFRYKGRPGLGPLTGNGRRANRFEMKHCEIKTFQPQVWLKVDIALTRLCVKPEVLWLLRVRDARLTATQTAKDVALLRRLVDSASACLWSAEASPFGEVRVNFISPVIAKITGRPAIHFGSDFVTWKEIILADDRTLWEDACRRRLGGESTDDEYRIVWPDESVRWVRECVQTDRAYLGAPCRMFGTISDITRYK